MNKKFLKLVQPSMRLYFFVLILFAVLTFFFGSHFKILVIFEVAIIVLLFAYTFFNNRIRKKKLIEYFESLSGNISTAGSSSLANFPMPSVIYNPTDGNIMWSNEKFREIANVREHLFESSLFDIVPNYSGRWITEGSSESPDLVELNGRKYKIFGNMLRSNNDTSGEREFLSALYWMDVTEFADVYNEYNLSRPVASVILIDNYDEILKGYSEKDKSVLLSRIDELITKWMQPTNGYLAKIDRDRYCFIFEDRYLKNYRDEKFEILNQVRELSGSGGVHATLSIGVGKDGTTLEECFKYANLSTEMALSRGGDQAVIKNKYNFEFFGGQSAEFENSTKVKARVMANALGELIEDASSIFVMGHKMSDLDCVGAAVGICCLARAKEKPCSIVTDYDSNLAKDLILRMKERPEYEHSFITAQQAILAADSKSLLIIVDTNRPQQVESETLLLSCNKIAVIDHHRRASSYIENPDINIHEPAASSACEIVTELLTYLINESDILRYESEALLSGIVLDTKNFSLRTGSRTFDAAAFLRRCGADTTEVKKLFQADMESELMRYSIICKAEEYRSNIAIAATDESPDRVTIAKAADELLNISGIKASFVIAFIDDATFISGRSLGQIDVQQILEKLGGGGNQVTAGCQMKNTLPSEAKQLLQTAIDDYLQYTGKRKLLQEQ